MQRYSLMFSGELLPDLSVEMAAQRLASYLGIDEPSRLLPLFSGKDVTLRRNLSVQEAREQFLALRKAGLRVYLQPSSAAVEAAPDGGIPDFPALEYPSDIDTYEPDDGTSSSETLRNTEGRRNALEGLLYAALIAAGLVILRLALLPPAPPPLQLLALGTDIQQRLWVLDNQRLHRLTRSDETDRSETLPEGWIGQGIAPQLAVLADNSVLLNGWRESGWTLQRCEFTSPLTCRALPLAPSFSDAPAFAVQAASQAIIAVDHTRNELLLLDEQGAVLAHAERDFIEAPALVIQQGLLYLGSATAPGLDVLSIDRERFGQQLDQLLIDPSFVTDGERVTAALAVDTGWWLVLRDTAAPTIESSYRLIRVDEYLGNPQSLPITTGRPRALVKQGPRILALNDGQDTLMQFSLSGQVGQAVSVAAIDVHNQSLRARERGARWQLGVATAILLLAALLAGLGLARHMRRAKPLNDGN